MTEHQLNNTPFMTFWAALNAELSQDGREITFGPARRLWAEAIYTASLHSTPTGLTREEAA